MKTCESESITKKSASNLALAFVLLPRQKRQGMSALYAFCREVDDVADEETSPVETRRQRLQEWRDDVHLACSGGSPVFAVNQELQPFIQQHGLRFELFDELLKGVESDLYMNRYQTMEELELYCYRVASVVGLLSIEIFGYRNPRTKDYAVYLGKALQLTNILRDVRNDAEKGRIYFPIEEMNRFSVKEADLLAGRYTPEFERLATHFGEVAQGYYQKASRTLPEEDRRSMGTAELMGAVYWQLLEKLQARKFNVFGFKKTRLSKIQKLFLISRMWFRLWRGTLTPNYGAG
ncbi:MAG: presqualene diphosphate synthase HpnD [Verrucomicrobiota bacterium]|nr:presqualene diphosphate synthase HpnD [Verrucomicrobiota bacterium]